MKQLLYLGFIKISTYLNSPKNPFTTADSFIKKQIAPITNLGITIAAIGLIFTAMGHIFGSEHEKERFKTWMRYFVISILVMVTARGLVEWLKRGFS